MVIEKNIPLPDNVAIKHFPKQRLKDLMSEMEVNDSVFVNFNQISEHHIRGIVANYAKNTAYNKRFAARKTNDSKGLRVWRIK